MVWKKKNRIQTGGLKNWAYLSAQLAIFQKQVGIVAVRSNPAGRKTKGKFAPAHEYALFFGKTESAIPCGLSKSNKSLARYPKEDDNGRFAWANFIDFDFPKARQLVSDCIKASGIKIASSIVLDFFAGSGTTGHAVINLNREDGGKRKYILVEMGNYFDTVLKPRITKGIYSESWKDGKPAARHTGISHCFKYLRLESYEDSLNNLLFDKNPTSDRVISTNTSLKEDFMLHYLLDVETLGSQSLLNIDAFADPTAYTLKIKKPGSDEYTVRNVDLVETFTYLIGLRVVLMAEPQIFTASFKRSEDPEEPKDQKTKLVRH